MATPTTPGTSHAGTIWFTLDGVKHDGVMFFDLYAGFVRCRDDCCCHHRELR